MTLQWPLAWHLFAKSDCERTCGPNIPLLGENGLPPAVSMVTTSAVLGSTLLGWTIGGRDRPLAASANFLLPKASGVALMKSQRCAHGVLGLRAVWSGVGNVVSLPQLIAQHEFSAADVGKVVALVGGVNQDVFALAPAVIGLLRHISTVRGAVRPGRGKCKIVAALMCS